MINKLRVSGFRSFKDLTVEGLGRVNLITGRNNVGKSTLLEAIRLWVTEGAAATFLEILRYREEDQGANKGSGTTLRQDGFLACNHLFYGFPSMEMSDNFFSIAGENGGSSLTLTARFGWHVIVPDDDEQTMLYIPASLKEAQMTTEGTAAPTLEITTPHHRRTLRLDKPSRFQWPISESARANGTTCRFLDPFSSRETGQLASLWDRVALTDSANDVVQALQIISKDIQAVTMISDGAGRSRTAIVRSNAYERPVPLKSFGDGVNRVFGLILSLTCAKGGYLLVDEIENGLHHSILADAFRAIFKLARKLDVQVFATTHSRDCIEAFQKAAEESPDEGVLIRLTRKDDKIFSTVFPEKQLQIVTEDQIEVR